MPHQRLLRRIDVLKFIDQQMMEHFLILRGDGQRFRQHVVQIAQAVFGKAPLVLFF